jgi:tRNA (cytidine/uridine-2'-O-)-methyltransferase
LLEEHRDYWLRIPMFNERARSLNLSNCVALVLFEALRQLGFPGEAGAAGDGGVTNQPS